ncbi:two component transcriptional regulator, LuxR family [Tardiphaga sp. OK246]|uniref:response regulator n=1 Tax=Tardiphaga sp. OK246 TaxID=1855307 RepID=UPI000B705F00|nr:response regulator transcription factor [Tardiphaga sp. OK246]SNT11811.1 two component transcriptional regulator, LuxR family [Tardiphaga sp. OK246]
MPDAAAVVRILIADDHDVVRSGLRAIVEHHPGWEVVGEAEDGKTAVNLALATKPDILITDYALPVMNGVEVTRQVRSRLRRTEVLMFTMHDTDEIITQALAAGARAFLLKSDAKQYLISAIESLAARKPFFTGRLSERMLDSYIEKETDRVVPLLSPRERIVVQLIAEGNSNRDISALLNVSIKTVESQRSAAMKKIDATSTAALVRYAIRNRIIEP